MPQRYDWAVETVKVSELKKQLTSLDAGGFEILDLFPLKAEWALDSLPYEVIIIARRPKPQS